MSSNTQITPAESENGEWEIAVSGMREREEGIPGSFHGIEFIEKQRTCRPGY